MQLLAIAFSRSQLPLGQDPKHAQVGTSNLEQPLHGEPTNVPDEYMAADNDARDNTIKTTRTTEDGVEAEISQQLLTRRR